MSQHSVVYHKINVAHVQHSHNYRMKINQSVSRKIESSRRSFHFEVKTAVFNIFE